MGKHHDTTLTSLVGMDETPTCSAINQAALRAIYQLRKIPQRSTGHLLEITPPPIQAWREGIIFRDIDVGDILIECVR